MLNSFLQFLENDDGPSLVVAATNHPELLDRALYRRFDDVITYDLPTPDIARGILESRLVSFEHQEIDWPLILEAAADLSQADIARAADEAAKTAVLSGSEGVLTRTLLSALQERHAAALTR